MHKMGVHEISKYVDTIIRRKKDIQKTKPHKLTKAYLLAYKQEKQRIRVCLRKLQKQLDDMEHLFKDRV
jgi:hypothetical protein